MNTSRGPRTTRRPSLRRLHRSRVVAPTALMAALAAVGAGCSTGEKADDAAARETESASPVVVGSDKREARTLAPRALVARDGGLTLIDTETGETISETEHDGFIRLNDGGDGRHVVIADGDTFRVYDTGIATEAHGDHGHHFTYTPGLTAASHASPTAGHAVPHAGWTALFSDGTGEITLLPTAEIASTEATTTILPTSGAHHGVALRLQDGSVATTWSKGEERNGIRLLKNDQELAATDDCAGVHGEAAAAPTRSGEVLAFGCTDGPVVLRDGTFHKVKVDEEYVRTGNLAGHPYSPVVLTDRKIEADAEFERPTTIGLLNTRTDSLDVVELGSSYWFRSLGRSADGDALVLTYDGSLRVIDAESGEQAAAIDAIAPWREKEDWQQPGPVLDVVGDLAYISDAESGELVVVDLESRTVLHRHALPEGVVEMVVTAGVAADELAQRPSDSHDHGSHADHDH